MARQTWASRGAVALLAVLAVLQLWWAGWSHGGPVFSTGSVLFPITLVAGALLARINRFETRLVVVLVCLAQLAVTALSLLIGLPGQPRAALDEEALEALLLPAVVLGLLVVDRRVRRPASPGAGRRDPYAR